MNTSAHFTVDWFDHNIEDWGRELSSFRGRPRLRFLEIGCFEGRATRWLLEHILTDPSSTIDVIDTFEGSIEHQSGGFGVQLEDLRGRFERNVSEFADRVNVHQGLSRDCLRPMQAMRGVFDFIYVDGSHHQDDVYLDAVLSWGLLKVGGMLAFDDYKWRWKDPNSDEIQSPAIGIDRFLKEHRGDFALVLRRYQLHVVKRSTGLVEHWLRTLRWNGFFSKFPIRRSQIERIRWLLNGTHRSQHRLEEGAE